MPEMNKKTLRNIFLIIAGAIVLYWLLVQSERVSALFGVIMDIFSPFVIGAAIAFILNVPMRAFERLLKGIEKLSLRRALALLLTFLSIGIVIAGAFLLLIPQLVETIESLLPKLQTFFVGIGTDIKALLEENPQLMEWIGSSVDLEKMDLAGIVQKFLSMASNSVTAIVNGAFSAIGTVTGALVEFVIGFVFAIYALFQKEALARQGKKLMYAYLPEKFCDRAVRVLRLSSSTFSNFLSGQCLEMVILGCMFAVAMAIFRLPYIPLVSVLVAITGFIPVVGAWVGCALGAFLILVANPMQALWFVIMFVVLQQIENNLIYPRVVGTSIGISGMWVLVAVSVGGELMGVTGMLLMIPLVSVIHVVLRQCADKRLRKRGIDPEKLKSQPPELRSRLKEKREKRKARQLLTKLRKKQKNTENKTEE